jgi:hypothetical protein
MHTMLLSLVALLLAFGSGLWGTPPLNRGGSTPILHPSTGSEPILHPSTGSEPILHPSLGSKLILR